jgi:hypothetical protein
MKDERRENRGPGARDRRLPVLLVAIIVALVVLLVGAIVSAVRLTDLIEDNSALIASSCERGNASRQDNFDSKVADAADFRYIASQINDHELDRGFRLLAERREEEADEIVDTAEANGGTIAPGSVQIRC